MRSILIGLCVLILATPTFARGPVRVRGYTTKNGTYVAPHYRSAPDRSKSNNWSTRGNVNPYTGQPGTKNPYGGSYYPQGYSAPTYSYPSPSYRYVPPSNGYGSPSYGYTSPSYGSPSLNYGCRNCTTNTPQANQSIDQVQQGEIVLASGVVKVPARTASGYCLRTPYGYVGTGDLNYPAVTSGMPRCKDVADAKETKEGLWRPLR